MRLIDADALRKKMYHEAFETDSDMQKWESGCWVRYKMFENALESAPTIDAVPVVRCKDCRFYRYYDGSFGKGWMCFENNTARHGDDYCSWGERKDDEVD